MEMGSAICRRLFAAIELRIESSGSLNVIIAALLPRAHHWVSNTRSSSGMAGGKDMFRWVLSNLLQSSSSTIRGTKESLIVLLSRRSRYRDAALLQLEHTLVDLELQLKHNLTPKGIADIAGGEGGTMAKEKKKDIERAYKKMTAKEKSDLIRKLTELDTEHANDDESAPSSPIPV